MLVMMDVFVAAWCVIAAFRQDGDQHHSGSRMAELERAHMAVRACG